MGIITDPPASILMLTIRKGRLRYRKMAFSQTAVQSGLKNDVVLRILLSVVRESASITVIRPEIASSVSDLSHKSSLSDSVCLAWFTASIVPNEIPHFLDLPVALVAIHHGYGLVVGRVLTRRFVAFLARLSTYSNRATLKTTIANSGTSQDGPTADRRRARDQQLIM